MAERGRIVVVTPPAREPVLEADVAAHLRLDQLDDPSISSVYIPTARDWCETFTGRALIERTVECYWNARPSDGVIVLPVAPVIELVSVKVYDQNDQATALASNVLHIVTGSEPPRIAVDAWPSVSLRAYDALVVEAKVGYGPDPDSVPARLRASMLLLVGALHEQREDIVIGQPVTRVPLNCEWLARPYRLHTGIG